MSAKGPGAVLEFGVTLSRSTSGTVTVAYATSDGTAQAGADYTAASGTATFAPGETRKTVEVTVLDDAHDEGSETLTLALSNPSGAYLADGEARGTIENSDPLPQAWLSRFGRSAAVQVVTLLDERFEAAAGAGEARLTLGGRAVDVAALRTLTPGQAGAAEPGPRARTGSGCAAGTGAPPGARAPACGKADRVAPAGAGPGGSGAGPGGSGAGVVRLDDEAGTFGQPGADVSAAPAAAAEAAEAAEAAGEATLLERALWTLLTQRGRVQFDARQFISQSSFDVSWTGRGEPGGSPARPGDDCTGCEQILAPVFDGRWTLWGRGALMQFSGEDRAVTVSGDVLTGLLGVDYARDRWLAGAALAYHDGDGSYSSVGAGGTGDLDSVLVTVNPYLHYALTPRLSAWGTLGYGAGTLSLRQAGAGGQGEAAVIETDVRMGMGALGLRGVVYAGAHTELALKSDAMWVRTSSARDGGHARRRAPIPAVSACC